MHRACLRAFRPLVPRVQRISTHVLLAQPLTKVPHILLESLIPRLLSLTPNLSWIRHIRALNLIPLLDLGVHRCPQRAQPALSTRAHHGRLECLDSLPDYGVSKSLLELVLDLRGHGARVYGALDDLLVEGYG